MKIASAEQHLTRRREPASDDVPEATENDEDTNPETTVKVTWPCDLWDMSVHRTRKEVLEMMRDTAPGKRELEEGIRAAVHDDSEDEPEDPGVLQVPLDQTPTVIDLEQLKRAQKRDQYAAQVIEQIEQAAKHRRTQSAAIRKRNGVGGAKC